MMPAANGKLTTSLLPLDDTARVVRRHMATAMMESFWLARDAVKQA